MVRDCKVGDLLEMQTRGLFVRDASFILGLICAVESCALLGGVTAGLWCLLAYGVFSRVVCFVTFAVYFRTC